MRFLAYVFAAMLIVGIPATHAAVTSPKHTHKTSLGTVLTTAKGMTLYTFAHDTAGKSNCNGKCAAHWPPFVASAKAKPMGKWSIIRRANGERQWAYKGHPLYAWFKDHKPGQTTGNGLLKGAWHVARP